MFFGAMVSGIGFHSKTLQKMAIVIVSSVISNEQHFDHLFHHKTFNLSGKSTIFEATHQNAGIYAMFVLTKISHQLLNGQIVVRPLRIRW